jgi:hypothetical protein
MFGGFLNKSQLLGLVRQEKMPLPLTTEGQKIRVLDLPGVCIGDYRRAAQVILVKIVYRSRRTEGSPILHFMSKMKTPLASLLYSEICAPQQGSDTFFNL